MELPLFAAPTTATGDAKVTLSRPVWRIAKKRGAAAAPKGGGRKGTWDCPLLVTTLARPVRSDDQLGEVFNKLFSR